MTDLERYCTGILDGKIVACRRMKQVAERLLEDLASPGEFHFDPDIAARHIDFIQQFCKVPSGRLGTPLKLELFQRARLEAVFGFVDDSDLRRYNEVLIVEGRKNGKTTETAAIELDLLVNDGEGSPQIYNVATKLDQARLGYEAAVKMRQLSPMLAKHLRKRVSDIYNPMNMGYIRPMASNTSSLDGLDAHGATIDELAAIKNRDLYDLIKQAMGARDQPLLFVITTNGFVRGGIFDAQYQYACDILEGKADNPRFLPFLYELDDRAEWDNPDCWEKANPGLGTIKSRQYLAEMVQKAKDDPSFKPTVMVKDFNMPQTSEAAWLRWEELDNPTTFDLRFDYGIGGFDAADTTDLNAAKAICMRPDDPNIYVRSMYWIPKAVLEEAERAGSRRERDNVPYYLWVEQGYMRTCPGRKCDKHIFLEWFKELRDNEGLYMLYIGYDPWHIDDSLLREFRAEFGPDSMIPVRQGPATLSQPMKDLAADFRDHRVLYNNNPVDKWCLVNSEAKTDVNGNIQLVKSLDPRRRVDGTAALLCAYTVLQDKKDLYINLN
ncbi:terminase large subunit [Flavonifractor plautii]|uniref:terminase large subunit n=1 Tax=Flavonifractor plautii TaxID=292800 RepID=UPI001D029B56|nr:terminase large subunit [Flavonifractor plautii]MCB5582052.1 terminase large subunit [Flavonifractor plautii]